jgi:hypothetical protein
MRRVVTTAGRVVAWMLVVGCFSYSLLFVVNCVAFLSGAGTPVTVHIERSDREGGLVPSGGGPGVTTWAEGDVGRGYYDLNGERHAVTLYGVEAPAQVQTRRPLLAEGAVLFLHAWWQAAAGMGVGLFFTACAGFVGWALSDRDVPW